MAGALDGILVVSLEQAVAAPLCSCRLADSGARVIKVERAEGDFARGYDRVVHGESAYFVWLNRGKESIVIDIKDAGDAAFLRRIIGRADVFIQNLAPGAAARAGFGARALRKETPRLVTCAISGYGSDGPYAGMKAYDFLLQCESGLASVTGTAEAPGRVGVSVCDIAAGLNAYAAIVEALLARTRTGVGAEIGVSLFDAMADWMNVPLLHQTYGGAPPPRAGLHHPSIAPYGAYPAGDGGTIVIAIQNEREWRRFCAEVLEQPELADDPELCDNSARVANRPRLDAHIAEAFAGFDVGALAERLHAADIAFGRLNSLADLARHPELRRITVETASGPAELAPPPVRSEGGQANPGPVPALGAHTEALRREFAA